MSDDSQSNDYQFVVPMQPEPKTFPLTKDEAAWIYRQLSHQWLNREDPYYHYGDSLLGRMKRFVEKMEANEKLQ